MSKLFKAQDNQMASAFGRIRQKMAGLTLALERLRDDIKGVAAIEFAFLAPLMLLMYVGTIEISAALSANRKLSRVSSTIGDLLTQTDCYTNSTVSDIMEVADDIMYPYTDALAIRVSGIKVADGAAKVVWSKADGTTEATAGTPYDVPSRIKIDGNFLVAANITMSYKPTIGWLSTTDKASISIDDSAINMEEELFLRPRVGDAVSIESSC